MNKLKVVYKYHLDVKIFPSDCIIIKLPKGAEILTALPHNNKIYLWALVDPDVSVILERRIFRVIGTGHKIDIDTEPKYVSTFIDGELVLHVFELVISFSKKK